jgi:hypothetical protein
MYTRFAAACHAQHVRLELGLGRTEGGRGMLWHAGHVGAREWASTVGEVEGEGQVREGTD